MQTEFGYLVIFKFGITRRAISKVCFTSYNLHVCLVMNG